MNDSNKKILIVLDSHAEQNDCLQTRLSRYENIELEVFTKPQEAIVAYMKKFPDIFIIDPLLKNTEGIETPELAIQILEQFVNNNSNLEKPVNLIVVSDDISDSTRKVLKQLGIKNICPKTDGVSIEKILNTLFTGDDSLVLKKAELEIDLPEDMVKELLAGTEFKNRDEIEYLFTEYPGLNGADPKQRDKKRRLLRNLIKYFWEGYENIALNMVSTDPENIWKIIFCRFCAILNLDWLTPNIINEIYDFTTNQTSEIENIFYTDEYLRKIWKGEILPAYNDIVVQEFRRVRDMYSMLKGLNTNSEENYLDATTKYLGLQKLGFLKASKRLIKIEVDDLMTAGKEELFCQEIKNMLKLFTKMCIGIQGTKLPVLSIKSEGASISSQFTTKVAVNKIINDVVKIDPKIFLRVKLNEERKFQEYHIKPYIVILPCVSNQGTCWDAWHDANKRTSPGRIGIPIIFERTLEECVLKALGHLRWRTAKSDADIYWMEEGLTGQYYQYYEDNKKKRDEYGRPVVSSLAGPEDSFVQDYILWIKYESQGQLKLKKELREIFWFSVPFPDKIKKNLKGRGQLYEELLLKDERRAQSRFTGS